VRSETEGTMRTEREAKVRLVEGMLQGESWQDAVIAAGLALSRSGAYRLTWRVCVRGDAALEDQRHGHVGKMQPPLVEWLEAYCRAAPQTPSRVVQAALQERFGVRVSISHLNRLRAARGLSRRAGGEKGGPGASA
jgi:transposase